jgi:peptidyl-prolyl cis-trans isomerase-like 6
MLYWNRFEEFCPQAVDNFMKLCVGVEVEGKTIQYKGCPIHRIVKDGWIQCGDVINGTGANSMSVTDVAGIVPDESFTVDFGFQCGGIVGFANNGAHSSGSQFFITTGPCEWMNHNFVGVGRVLQGFHVLRTLNQVQCSNQRPHKNITILSCGITPLV